MRLLATTLLLLMHCICDAQSDSLTACIDKLASAPAYAMLAAKIAVGAAATATPAMLADTSFASNKEREVISDWAAARAACLQADSRYGNEIYRAPMQTFGIDAENKVMAAAVELYDRKLSFGEFNRRRQAVAEELRGKIANLRQDIQSRRAVQEQADRQTREREQMQREIDDAEWEATIARQQAEQARQAAARRNTRPYRPELSRRYEPAPIAQYRNCYRFGNRLTCTGW